jgi:hypothetical protein
MANEEETKTKKTSKEPVEIKPDPELKSIIAASKNEKKNRGKAK